MASSKIGFLAAAVCFIACGSARSEDLRNPYAIQRASLNYGYGQPEEPRSPSDLPPQPPVESPMMGTMDFEGCGAVGDCLCDECAGPCDPWHIFAPVGCGWQLTGWANVGGIANSEQPPSRFNGPWNWIYREDVTLNQFYTTFGRDAVTNGCGWDWGGRFDVMYGSDFRFVQSRGLELQPDGSDAWNSHRFYGLAMPQAYGEIAYNDLSVKLGHFYSGMGYEQIQAPRDFFYTRSYAFQYGGPFTLTGAVASWNATDMLQLVGGVHNGWNNFDPQIDVTGFVGGVKIAPPCRPWSLSMMVLSSDEPNAIPNARSNRTTYSLIFNYDLNDDWQYVLEHDYGIQHDAIAAPIANGQWYGINQYLFYRINDCWRAGVRAEWFRDDDGIRVAGSVPGNPNAGPYPGNFYEFSVGLNWTPGTNVIVRPEIRYDDFAGSGQLPFDDGTQRDQFTAAMDVIFLW